MMPLVSQSMGLQYGYTLYTQIVALLLHCARIALRAPPLGAPLSPKFIIIH